MRWIERDFSTRHFAPGHLAETDDYARTHERQFSSEMIAAVCDLIWFGIAIAPQLVARIAADEIGDEHAGETGMIDHRAEQLSRSIAGEGRAGAIAAVASRRNSQK